MRNKAIIISLIAVFLVLIVLAWLNIIPNSVLTLISPIAAVVVAILAYWIRQIDYKSDIAKAIIQEVRSAEKTIREIRPNLFIVNEISILPSDTWKSNRHLFASDLTSDEIDQIERFYSGCNFLDRTSRHIIDQILTHSDSVIEKKLESTDSLLTPKIASEIASEIEVYKSINQAGAVWGHFTASLGRIEMIGDTRAITKLMKIAKLR